MLVLHGGGGPVLGYPFADRLAEHFELIEPVHPGFAGTPIPDHFDGLEDLVYLYLDLMDTLELEQTIVIGDTPRDIACARADDVRVVAVTTGQYGPDELADADAVALDAVTNQILGRFFTQGLGGNLDVVTWLKATFVRDPAGILRDASFAANNLKCPNLDDANTDPPVLLSTLLTGVVYPLAVTGIGAWVFPAQVGGSLVTRDGVVVGSSLIAQSFQDPKYFWGRLSATSPMPNNGAASGGSNFGPLNPALVDAAKALYLGAVQQLEEPSVPLPVDADIIVKRVSDDLRRHPRLRSTSARCLPPRPERPPRGRRTRDHLAQENRCADPTAHGASASHGRKMATLRI